MNRRGGMAGRWTLAMLCWTLPAWLVPAVGQAQDLDDVPGPLLTEVMPDADRFSGPHDDPPVLRAWIHRNGSEVLTGFVFLTRDWPPERVGYNAPIDALVGLDVGGHLTGVRVLDYWESHQETMGDFLRRPGFLEGFAGKHLGEAFSVRDDVDGIARATVSVRALARGVRDASRRVAAAHLAMPAPSPERIEEPSTLSWFDLGRAGVVQTLVITDGGEGSVDVSLAAIEDEAFGEYLVGPAALGMTRRAIGARGGDAFALVYGLDGPTLRLFERGGWSVAQDADTVPVAEEDVFSFGLATGGVLERQVVAGGAMIVGSEIDPTRPFSILFDRGAGAPVFWTEYLTLSARRAQAHAVAQGLPEVAPPPEEPGSPAVGPPSEPRASPGPDATTPGVGPSTDDPQPRPRAFRLSEADRTAAETVPPAAEAVPPSPETVSPSSATPTRPTGTGATPPGLQHGGGEAVPPARSGLLDDLVDGAAWDRVALTLLLLALVSIAFAAKRPGLRTVTLAATLIWLGYVDGGFLSVSHLTSVLWAGPNAILTDAPLLLMVAFTVVTTLLFGRVFCGFLCPFGALQDMLTRVVPSRLRCRVPARAHAAGLWVKYGLLVLVLIPPIAGIRLSLYQYFEPFGTVFFWSPSIVLWAIAGAFLLASAFVPRFYCRYACPLGAALAIGSLVSLKRIRRVRQCDHCLVCEQKCPTGAITGPHIDFKECVRCNVCEIQLIERRGVCGHDPAEYLPRLVQLGGRAAASRTGSA